MANSGWRTLGTTVAAVGALGAATLAWASLVERTAYTLREVLVPVLPPGAEPVRVLHLSDLHMAGWQRDKQAWVRALAQLEPDLIVNTGDNLGHASGVAGIRAAFESFHGTPGVYVWGSNDYYGPSPKNPLRYFSGPSRQHTQPTELDIGSLKRYLDALGFTDLNNAAASIEVKGTRFEFFGVDDPHRGFDRVEVMAEAASGLHSAAAPLSRPAEDGAAGTEGLHSAAAQLSRPAGQADAVKVGVAHAPYQRVLDAFDSLGARLIFAGHTHGGQVCVPGFGALVTNCDLPREQVKGLSRWRDAYLHVSAGLGTSIYAPVRFACRPEATLLTLVPAAQASV